MQDVTLNPTLVEDFKELDKYPWTGHSAILGHRQNPCSILTLLRAVPPPKADCLFSFIQKLKKTTKTPKNRVIRVIRAKKCP